MSKTIILECGCEVEASYDWVNGEIEMGILNNCINEYRNIQQRAEAAEAERDKLREQLEQWKAAYTECQSFGAQREESLLQLREMLKRDNVVLRERAAELQAEVERMGERSQTWKDEAFRLQAEVVRLQKIANREPFYWTRPERFPADQCADEGWYVWTDRGLVYLGTMADLTMLDDPEDID